MDRRTFTGTVVATFAALIGPGLAGGAPAAPAPALTPRPRRMRAIKDWMTFGPITVTGEALSVQVGVAVDGKFGTILMNTWPPCPGELRVAIRDRTLIRVEFHSRKRRRWRGIDNAHFLSREPIDHVTFVRVITEDSHQELW